MQTIQETYIEYTRLLDGMPKIKKYIKHEESIYKCSLPAYNTGTLKNLNHSPKNFISLTSQTQHSAEYIKYLQFMDKNTLFHEFMTNQKLNHYQYIHDISEYKADMLTYKFKSYSPDELSVPFSGGDFIIHDVIQLILSKFSKYDDFNKIFNNFIIKNTSVNINQKNSSGKTILYFILFNHYIIPREEKLKIINHLIVRYKLDINVIDENKQTILHTIMAGCSPSDIIYYIKNIDGLHLLQLYRDGHGMTPVDSMKEALAMDPANACRTNISELFSELFSGLFSYTSKDVIQLLKEKLDE